LNPANLSTKRQWIAELASSKTVLYSVHHVIDLDWMKEAYRLTRADPQGWGAGDRRSRFEYSAVDCARRQIILAHPP